MRRMAWLGWLGMGLALFAAPAAGQTPAPAQTLSALVSGVPAARFFGQSTAMSGDGQYLAVGAPWFGGSSGGTSAGVVLVFTRAGSSWAFLNALQAPTPGAGDGFGYHVSFVGQQLVVGAPFSTSLPSAAEGAAQPQRGRAYVYHVVAAQYALLQELQAGAPLDSGDWYGFNTSGDAGWLAVGAAREGALQGQVQLFRYDANAELWEYHGAIEGVPSGGQFGQRVLLRGDRLLVAAPEEQSPAESRGHVYDFQRSGNGASAVWTQTQRIHPTSGVPDTSAEVFGGGLALSPTRQFLVIGSPFAQAVPPAQSGAAYVFERDGSGQWVQRQRLVSPAGSRAVNFGGAMSFVHNNALVIGDVREADATTSVQGGAVRQFVRGVAGWQADGAWVRGSTGIANDFMSSAVLVRGAELIVGASGFDNGASADEGRVFVFRGGALDVFRDSFE